LSPFQVIYFSDKHADKPETIASKKLFDMAGVAYRQFIPTNKKIVIDFDVINA
jgi:dCMP deaminase